MRVKYVLASLPLWISVFSPGAQADPALAASRNCMACHALDRKVVGPSFKEIASRYNGQKDAADRLSVKVLKGGTGAWGVNAMPANPQVSDAEAHKLVSWILGLK